MRTIRRRVADLIERVSGNRVIPVHELPQLAEVTHLRRLFDYLGVDCVFDVGANAGQHAELLRHRVGFRGPIISFEPIPELAADLARRSAADPHWHVQQLALDREAGQAVFHVMQNSEFSSLRRPAADQARHFAEMNSVAREVEVTRSTIAAEIARWQDRLGFQRPFLKLDTQGNDVAVVEGAGERIAAFVGLQSELAIRRLYDGAQDHAAALDFYRSRGFELSALVPNNAGHFPVLMEIDCLMVRRDLVPGDLRRD